MVFTVLCCGPALATDDTPGAYLGQLTWPEAERRLVDTPIVVLPFAAGAKEHGHHLPMNADQRVMEYLMDRAVENESVLIAPPILHGWFPSFREFPGTEVSDPGIFQDYVFSVAESLVRQAAQRIIFFNMGIARATGLPISIAAREIRAQHGTPTLVISWDDLETDEVAAFSEQLRAGHADETETAINLVLQPENVKMDLAQVNYGQLPAKDYPGYRPGIMSRKSNDPQYNPLGIMGDPTLATAEKGRKTLAIMEAQWLKALRGFAQMPTPGPEAES